MVRIWVDPEECCGYGECALAAPELMYLGEDNLAHFRDGGPVDREDAELAVAACPVQALGIQEDE
jgi:ferredoxin